MPQIAQSDATACAVRQRRECDPRQTAARQFGRRCEIDSHDISAPFHPGELGASRLEVRGLAGLQRLHKKLILHADLKQQESAQKVDL